MKNKLRTLHLNVKTIYFDQIKSGEKTEEYRLRNDYWTNRLFDEIGWVKEFDQVSIRNGYKSGDENVQIFKWHSVQYVKIQHDHFGPDPVIVFAIQLKQRISA